MSRNYTASTRDRVGDLVTGMRIDTSVALASVKLTSAQTEIFNVFGRILILEMYLEVITTMSSTASTVQFMYTSTVPEITVQQFSNTSTDTLNAAAVGDRLNYVGGALNAVPTVSATPAIGDEHCADPIILGLEGGTGLIGILTAGADATGATATIQFSIHYIPMSDGAYVTGYF
jgi:hypothetical protein